MDTLCKFVYRFLGIEEEEESEDLLSSNFHSRSQLAPPLSAISSGNLRRANDGHWSIEKKKPTWHFSDTPVETVLLAESSASKEKLRYPKKEITKPDSVLMESKKIASESHDALSISSCNNQNKHLTVEQSTSSHSDSLRRNSIEQLDNNTVSRYLANQEIFLTKVAAHLESLEEHEPRYKQKGKEVSKTSSNSKPTRKLVNLSALDFITQKFAPESYKQAIEKESDEAYYVIYGGEHVERHSGPHDKAATSSKAVERKIQDYCSSQKILLVGEGDFSFSACLAKAFDSVTNIVATSLNSEAYLRSNYKNAMDNIFLLRMRGCKVFHEVDATNMEKDWRIDGLLFDRIIFNFPHSGDFRNTEDALRGNQLLIKQFMENAVKMIEEDGEIHIRHKSNWYFLRWNLRGLASEAGGLVLIEEAPFDPCEFSGYNPKYGFEGWSNSVASDNNFNCHPSCTYKFVLSKRQKKLRQHVKCLRYIVAGSKNCCVHPFG